MEAAFLYSKSRNGWCNRCSRISCFEGFLERRSSAPGTGESYYSLTVSPTDSFNSQNIITINHETAGDSSRDSSRPSRCHTNALRISKQDHHRTSGVLALSNWFLESHALSRFRRGRDRSLYLRGEGSVRRRGPSTGQFKYFSADEGCGSAKSAPPN